MSVAVSPDHSMATCPALDSVIALVTVAVCLSGSSPNPPVSYRSCQFVQREHARLSTVSHRAPNRTFNLRSTKEAAAAAARRTRRRGRHERRGPGDFETGAAGRRERCGVSPGQGASSCLHAKEPSRQESSPGGVRFVAAGRFKRTP
jgi:hypothetical protein